MQISQLVVHISEKRWPSLRELGRYYRLMFQYVKPYWLAYIVIFALLFGNVFLTIAYAWFLRGITEAAVHHQGRHLAYMFFMGSLIFASTVGVDFLNYYLRTLTVNKVKRDIKAQLFGRVLRLSSHFFHAHHSGDLVSRFTQDVDTAVEGVGPNFLNTVTLLITALAVFAYLFHMNRHLALISLLFGPIVLLSAIVFSKYLRTNGILLQRQFGAVASLLNESLRGYTTIRSFALEHLFIHKYRQAVNQLLALQTKEVKLSGGFFAGADFGASTALWLCLGIGTLDVANGRMSVGSLLAFVALIQHLVSPFTGVAKQFGGLQRSIAAAGRIEELLRAAPEGEVAGWRGETESAIEGIQSTVRPIVAHAAESSAGQSAAPRSMLGEAAIRFERVTFSYDGQRNALDNFTFTVPTGKTTAFVGPSGAGKSTLFGLGLGFYRPTSGAILLGNERYDSLDDGAVRRHMAYVPQETFMFSGTLRENILYGRPDATELELVTAAKEANAHDFIMSFPVGYETEVGEHGLRLSGGQRQRIAIARAILKNSPILLLDEATSALDMQTEHVVKKSLEKLMENRTTLVIAHRLSTVHNADWIVVMDTGRIVEQGTHPQLLLADGMYARLYEAQFRQDDGNSSIRLQMAGQY